MGLEQACVTESLSAGALSVHVWSLEILSTARTVAASQVHARLHAGRRNVYVAALLSDEHATHA